MTTARPRQVMDAPRAGIRLTNSDPPLAEAGTVGANASLHRQLRQQRKTRLAGRYMICDDVRGQGFTCQIKSLVTSGTNRALRPLGVQMVRGSSADPAIRSFLSARKTIAAARRAGLSLSDYIDQFSAEPGTTASTVEAMLRLAELRGHVDRICEIGAGTGRYAERVIAALERYNRNGRQRGGHRQCSQFLPPSHLRAQGRKPASPGGPWGQWR